MCACGIRTPRYDTRTEAIAAWNTRPPINRPSPEAGESGKQPFEQYLALASWIERLANTNMDLPLGDWMVFLGALNMTLANLQAELAEAREERDGEKAARRSLSMLAADEVDTANALRDLLFRARWYVNDALEAHEHSDGRNLLREIDAALPVQALASLSPAKDEERGNG